MTDKPTDYAAIIRATETKIPLIPEWLKTGSTIYSSEYGIGKITAILGKRLIVDFL
ncbi:MAG: hypothetical protein QNJ68_21645 [Microcoleaceae cyanobacterium MO_207.B10]|nr:hypothetical protein [Microcoleaceae cyanobacterium MO_207.B10]